MEKLKTKGIDAHQHFWHYDPAKHIWMSNEMGILKTDFLPTDLAPLLKGCGLKGCVAVQANQAEEENTFLLNLAAQHDFIKGIVGWVDLRSENVEERLKYYQQFPKIKGFRHVLHDENQRDFMLRPDFIRGISHLKKYNYTYDILIFTDQLAYTLDLVKAFPEQPFVIDHIAKPLIKQQIVGEWKDYMLKIASHKNVYCKISGLVTEADWTGWKKEDFKTYLDIVVEAFGVDRIMYGSDWPVCQLAATYKAQFGIVQDYFSSFSKTEQNKFFGGNAKRFYNL
jgi:L-fuconolactonase